MVPKYGIGGKMGEVHTYHRSEICAKWKTGEREEAPLDGHTNPKEEFCSPLKLGMAQIGLVE